MAQKKVYDKEFKIQAVKLGREIGFSKAAKEQGVNTDTLYGWNKCAKDARLDLGPRIQTLDPAMSLTEEVRKLRRQNKKQAKEITRLKEENEFLAKASAFYDNVRCEAMWARMKEELLYGRYDTKKMAIEELKTLIWRYFMIYWNNRRICSVNGGLPPMLKRKQYYESLEKVA